MTHHRRPARFALDQGGITFLGAPGEVGTKSERGAVFRRPRFRGGVMRRRRAYARNARESAGRNNPAARIRKRDEAPDMDKNKALDQALQQIERAFGKGSV
ncbi:MAG: DNA recombination/repair protein RecA, partial [Acetobacteraceae bacterium]|nr:DNA recombination/repair protein RecA [Acetobacteraceae bacterium]